MVNWVSGEHCEPSTLVNMLLNRGIEVSEPLVFGLRFHLDYAHEDFPFAAHYLACVGYTSQAYTVVETTGLGVSKLSVVS